MMQQVWREKELDSLIACREKAAEMGGFDGVKFIKAGYNFEGSWLTFSYTSEQHVDVSKLARSLRKRFRCRVEMRQVGPRDSAKILGGYGACGQPRCCSTFLTEFSPISIKMAKAQGISLNPSEITGMCGRLRCCLVYEYEQYVEARGQLPRVKKRVGTPHGEGKVVDVHPLRDAVTVLVGEQRHLVERADLEPLEELDALKDKASKGCGKKNNGGPCECGARK
jgi:cell fate regulator YaaT (PSP1 superfamily)